MVKTLKIEPKSLLQKTPSLIDSVVKSDIDNNYHFWCVHYRPNTLADNTLFHHSSQKHGDRHIAAGSDNRGSCWVSDLAGVAKEWSWGGSWKARPLGSASSNPAWRPVVGTHLELWEGRGESGGRRRDFWAMCSPAAPQVCSRPETRANHSHLKTRPRGPGPRWCHIVLGCHLD